MKKILAACLSMLLLSVLSVGQASLPSNFIQLTPNNQTTSYTLVGLDQGRLITFNSSSNVTLTLPAPGSGAFINGYTVQIENFGTGQLTIAHGSVNIDGLAADVVLVQNQGASLSTDGTNWMTQRGSTSHAVLINAQVGTSYTVLNGDRSKIITFNNASPIAVTLPQAGAASQFINGWFAYFDNIGTGTVTITPTTSTIDGFTSISLVSKGWAVVFTDGTNYFSIRVSANAVTLQTLNSAIFFADQYADIPTAVDACQAFGGGTVYDLVPGIHNITRTVNIGSLFNTSSPCVVVGGNGVTWNIKVQNHQPGIRTYDGAVLRGQGGTVVFQGGNSTGFKIKEDPLACVSSLLENGTQDGSQQEFRWENLYVSGSLTHSGTGNCQEDVALIHVRGTADLSLLDTIYVDTMSGIGILFDSPTQFTAGGSQAFSTTSPPTASGTNPSCTTTNGICRTSNIVEFNTPPSQGNNPDTTGLFNGAGVVIAGCTGGAGATYNRGGAVSSASESVNTATIILTSGGNFGVGEKVYIQGVTPSGYNGVYTTIGGTSGTTVVVTNPTSGLGAAGAGGSVGISVTMTGPHTFQYTEVGQSDDTGASVTACTEQPVMSFAGTTPFFSVRNLHAIGTAASGQKPLMVAPVSSFSAGVPQANTNGQINLTFDGGNAQSADAAGGHGCSWTLTTPCWGAFTLDGYGSSGTNAPSVITIKDFHLEGKSVNNAVALAIKDSNNVYVWHIDGTGGSGTNTDFIKIACNTTSTTYNLNFYNLWVGNWTNMVVNACNGTRTYDVATYGKTWRGYFFGGNASNNCATPNTMCGVAIYDRTHDIYAQDQSNLLAQTGNIASQNLVLSTGVNALTHWRINYYLNQNALCTTGQNQVALTFGWTDAGGARTLTTPSLILAASQVGTAYLQNSFDLFTTAATAITYTSTVTGTCTSGTSSYDVHASAEQLQ